MKKADNKQAAETQWFLFRRKFRRHKLARTALGVIGFLFVVGVLLPGFFSPYSVKHRFDNEYLSPQRPHFIDAQGGFHLFPFAYKTRQVLDEDTWQYISTVDTSTRYPIRLFVRGDTYRVMGLFETDRHFFGVKDGGALFLFGTDKLGRDLFSRTLHALRISMLIGLMGVLFSLVFGVVIGGISGFVGGVVDDLIQRFIEIIMSIPRIPLWMAFAAAIPRDWTAVQRYFAITLVMSLLGWTSLARVVRSKFLSLREEDYILAARGFNVPMLKIIRIHMIPNFLSYILVHLTLAIPAMILGETALSFLGIGLQAPVVSLGVLLKGGQNIQNIAFHPWLLIPGVFVAIIVLGYSFIGDGLRDAADPYK